MVDSLSIKYYGDRVKAQSLIGLAKTQLLILKNAMSFQNLDQGRREVNLDDGSVIVCQSVFGINTINMFTPITGGGVVIEEKKYKQEDTVIVVFIFTLEDGPRTLTYVPSPINEVLSKKSVLVWDTRNRPVVVSTDGDSRCDYADENFQKWYLAKTFDDTELMFGSFYADNVSPYKIDPELVDTADVEYHAHNVNPYNPPMVIFAESVYGGVVEDMQIVKDNVAFAEYIGLRTEKEQLPNIQQSIWSCSAGSSILVNDPTSGSGYRWESVESYEAWDPVDKNSVDVTTWGSGWYPHEAAAIVRARFAPDTATYRASASSDVADTRHYLLTNRYNYNLYSKFGLLFTFESYDDSTYWHDTRWPNKEYPNKDTTIIIPDWNSNYYVTFPVGWSDKKKEAYSQSRYSSYIVGKYTNKTIVDLYVIQHNPLEQGTIQYGGDTTYEENIEEIWDFSPRVVTVHAQAKHTKSNSSNFNWIEEGRNTKLEDNIIAAVNYAYELNSIPDTETRGLTVEIKMFTKRLPEEEIHE